ncbi:MAG: thiamine diphosphokinase [Candidatus Marinimicrobia bacterium]|nr:thiamine diphosphokinase [Candidatus Neomarinimicrobiota bacterium]MCF7839383.1 thiamine diphosphokinase [Candidatus Neomarinimicrobiota bacterium]MCF7903458.1 thiamine diphosphokinase [Candidatus Neomarinimicrobiota bacterium]
MRILIILGGPSPQAERLQFHAAKADQVIAADGGAMACLNARITPDLIIGDLDSVNTDTIPESWHVERDKSQETTDFEKALGAISSSSKAISQLIILGGLGGRVDHELTNLHIAARLDPAWNIELEGADARIVRVVTRISLDLPVNATLSLVPWPQAFVRKTSGLQWNLTNTRLSPTSQLGQSNRVSQPPVTIELNDGMLYAIHILNEI